CTGAGVAQPRPRARVAATTSPLDVRMRKGMLMESLRVRWWDPDEAQPSTDGRTEERAQGRLEVLIATHDRAAAFADEVLDLQIADACLVVGAQAIVAAVADDALAACERVADLRRGSAVDVGAVENGDDPVGAVDRCAVPRGDLLVQPLPRALSRWPRRQRSRGFDFGRLDERPGIDNLIAERAHVGHEDRGMKVAPGLR